MNASRWIPVLSCSAALAWGLGCGDSDDDSSAGGGGGGASGQAGTAGSTATGGTGGESTGGTGGAAGGSTGGTAGAAGGAAGGSTGGTGGAAGAAGTGGGAGAGGGVTTHVVINFDELPSQTVVTDQYADHAVFSSEPGIEMTAESHIDIGQSDPNYLSAGSYSDVHHELFVDFTQPVSGLRFHCLSVTDSGVVATLRVVREGQPDGFVDVVGAGDSFTPVPVDLSAYTNVTRIEVIDITDTYGIVYDDFDFMAEVGGD